MLSTRFTLKKVDLEQNSEETPEEALHTTPPTTLNSVDRDDGTNVTNDGQRRQAKGDDDAEQPMQETLQSGSSMICKDKVDHEVKCLDVWLHSKIFARVAQNPLLKGAK